MKPFLIFALAIFFSIPGISAQDGQLSPTDGQRELIGKTRMEVKDGVQKVRLNNNLGTLTIRMEGGQVVAVSREFNRRTTVLQQSQGTAASGCPCGENCWEDEQEQQSICICKSCGHGGHDGWIDILSFSFGMPRPGY